MSKSKKNTIDPEKMINNYGADAVRLFIMSDSPPEKDVQWSTEGMEGSFKFIQKLWTLNRKFIDKINKDEKGLNNDIITKYTNSLIFKITNNLENFRYNVIVANFYEMYNFLIKQLDEPINKEVLINNYYIILKLLNPFIPHFASECLEKFSKYKKDQNEWPKINKRLLAEEKVKIVVQINGKKRDILELPKDISENEILNMINNNEKLKTYLDKKELIKKIFVPNKIINLIIK
jgi:leucyl-tRNA synthetase